MSVPPTDPSDNHTTTPPGDREPSYPRTQAPGVLGWLLTRYRVRLLARRVGRAAEVVRCAFVRPRRHQSFHIVSSERSAGDAAVRCLESVDTQDYDRRRIRHVFIDDASTDGTHDRVTSWLATHPDHSVDYIHRSERLGGTRNNLEGFSMASAGSIVIELNGDDWLPDRGVLRFLDKVYADDEVWMTYNTLRSSNGLIPIQLPPPRRIVGANRLRDWAWSTSHLHSFRAELLLHVDDEVMIDPSTGEYWAKADDVALYLAMLELAGRHARHLYRITCVYNFHAATEERLDREGQLACSGRIRAMPRRQPLASLGHRPSTAAR